MHHDAFEIDGLTGTVDGSVGEDAGGFVHARTAGRTFDMIVVLGQQHVFSFSQVDQEGIVAVSIGQNDLSILV